MGKTSSRRSFLKQSGLTAGGLATATLLGGSTLSDSYPKKRGTMKGLKISKMFIEPLKIEMEEPVVIALGTMTILENAIVTIVLENGIEGYGEASSIHHINGENQATILGTLNSCREFIVGQDINDYRSIAYTLKSLFWAQVTARCAIEMAMLDAYTKSLRLPLYRFLGGTDNKVETDYTIHIVPPAQAKVRARQLAAAGFRVIKTKVGRNLMEDIERIVAINDGAPQCGILIDANQGYTPKAALHFINEVVKQGVYPVMFEQPVLKSDLAGMKYVRDHTSVMVGADESVFTAMDAANVVRTGCADAINIKLMKSCIIEALDIAAIARSANLKLMIGCMRETNLGLGCAVHFAAGVGGFDFVDLDSHLDPENVPLTGGPEFKAPYWTIGSEPGLGVRFKKR